MNLDGFAAEASFVVPDQAMTLARERGVQIVPFRPGDFLVSKVGLEALLTGPDGLRLGQIQAMEYRDVYRPQLFSANTDLTPNCPRCDRPRAECGCTRCRDCDRLVEECECVDRCNDCHNPVDACDCERCRGCGEHIDNCSCSDESDEPTPGTAEETGSTIEGCNCIDCQRHRAEMAQVPVSDTTPVRAVDVPFPPVRPVVRTVQHPDDDLFSSTPDPTPPTPIYTMPIINVLAGGGAVGSQPVAPVAAPVVAPVTPVTPVPVAAPAWDIRVTPSIAQQAYWPAYKKVIQELLQPVIQKPVHVWAANVASTSSKELMNRSDVFDIQIMAGVLPATVACQNMRCVKTMLPDKIFGLALSQYALQMFRLDQPVPIWPEASPIYSEGYEVAGVTKNGLCSYFPIITDMDSVELFKRLILATLDVLKNGSTRALTREGYLKFSEGRAAAEKDRLTRDIANASEELNRVTRRVFETQRQFRLMEEEIKALENNAKYGEGKYEAEFDTITKTLPVTKMHYFGNALAFDTKELTVVDPRTGKTHLLGRFRIVMPLREGFIKIFNLDRTVNGMNARQQAPHVFEDGNACFGNLEAVIASYIGKRDVPALLHTVLSFLQSVNVDDSAGSHVDHWPVAGQPINSASYNPPSIKE